MRPPTPLKKRKSTKRIDTVFENLVQAYRLKRFSTKLSIPEVYTPPRDAILPGEIKN